MAEIALSLSGGGYRAAMYHLGTLHYLNHLKLNDGTSLLDNVNTISTISGGSITGLWYLMHYCQGKDIEQSFHKLYEILSSVDTMNKAFTALTADKADNCKLILHMVNLYDEMFFHNATFQLILDHINDGHIHHFSANGTDFSSGTAFRFQAARRKANKQLAVIGNNTNKLKPEIAGQIKLSEILAVSSCFPGGFEPVAFPDDFHFASKTENAAFVKDAAKFELMDGGVVDNQGTEPLLLANDQMCESGKKNEAMHDLILLSDVSTRYVDDDHIIDLGFSKHWNLTAVHWLIIGLMLIFAGFIAIGIGFDSPLLIGAGIAALAIVGFEGLWLIIKECELMRKLNKLPLGVRFNPLRRMSFYKLGKLLESRVNCMFTLSQEIFMKPIRQMRYMMIYGDTKWTNRRKSSNVHDLASDGSWMNKKGEEKYLIPSSKMIENSNMAAHFGTTLWFTKDDMAKGMPQALFAAGQYTLCFNLLEYIAKMKATNMENTNEFHQQLLELEPTLRSDWEKFKDEPRYMNYK